MPEVVSIDLVELSRGMPGLSPGAGAMLAEAGSVCFAECGHPIPVGLAVDGDLKAAFTMTFAQPTDQITRTYADAPYTTEHGAYGVAILIVSHLTEYTVVRRSWKSTGFDWWLGRSNDKLFSDAARLEASGIRKGSNNRINSRLRIKTDQTTASDHTRLPAFAVVVEFGRPLSRVSIR